MASQKLLNEMNSAYRQLEKKYSELIKAFQSGHFELEYGWYNGHYHRDSSGEWEREAYPIPVISVKGLCDIEIQFDKISVSAKLKRETALEFEYEKLAAHSFEAYGVEDYLADYYHTGQTFKELKTNISVCGEEEIGFSFYFALETECQRIAEFAELLRREKFYY